MVVSQQILERVAWALGKNLPELRQNIQSRDLLEPDMGKLFWHSVEAEPGIYIILAGKVRLIDRHDNLVVSLKTGETFGELTLFSENFQPYSIRASANTRLCYLRSQLILPLLKQHPAIEQNLLRKAKLRDLLLLHHSLQPDARSEIIKLHQILPQLTNYQLAEGNVPSSVWQGELWLLRRGEILHSSGQKLIPGKIYLPEDLPQTEEWLVTSSVDLYSLVRSPERQTSLVSNPEGELNPDRSNLLSASDIKLEPFYEGSDNATLASESSNIPAVSIAVVKPREYQPPIKTANPKSKRSKKVVSKAYFPSPQLQANHFWQQFSQRYPFFLQQSASDCGAACLVMVGRYWGKRFSINRLRDLASVDRHGASLSGLADAAGSIGFTTRMVTATLDKLAEQTLPVIAHWEGKHYVVVYKVTRQQVIIADPAIGQLTLSREEFERGWTGYTLLLQPTVLLQKTSETSNSLGRYFGLIKP